MTHNNNQDHPYPHILAPAGSRASFLAAIAAGADAIYCGLKVFSARMKAENFSLKDLSLLSRLADNKGIRVYVAINTLLKPSEIPYATYIIKQILEKARVAGLIFSDLSIIDIARTAGYKGELHLSTLGNLSFHKGLEVARKLGIRRVVVPRELSLDEIRQMSQAAGDDIHLEAFIHGALCYCVSGRCYWSSWFGGKSGLRGQCVQPCRRIYQQDGQKGRFFSCQDLSVDLLTKELLKIPAVKAWKIEGRKKGPHYVYNTVSAYRLLRDHPDDDVICKKALETLDQALGRETTQYGFQTKDEGRLIQSDADTGSGKVIGGIQLKGDQVGVTPDIPLFPGDLLRVGFEDTPGHFIYKVRESSSPDQFILFAGKRKERPEPGTRVFLIDRRQSDMMSLISSLEEELKDIESVQIPPFSEDRKRLRPNKKSRRVVNHIPEMVVERKLPKKRHNLKSGSVALWLSEKAIKSVPPKYFKEYCWWLPPVVWPNDQRRIVDLTRRLLKQGVTRYVVNAPWQFGLIPADLAKSPLDIWVGPFCNIANPQSIRLLEKLGASGVIVAPELSRRDFIDLAASASLPLGIMLTGNWPMGVSRASSEDLTLSAPFSSPQGETSWMTRYGQDFWIYPNWKLDLSSKKKELIKAGFQLFVHMNEPLPRGISLRNRPGLWNWDLTLR